MLSRIAKTILRIPRQINLLDASQFTATGALAGLIGRVIYNRLKGKRKLLDGALTWSLVGAGLGIGGYALNRNAVEMMGGIAKDPKKVIANINDGSKDHVFYVPGATELTGMSDSTDMGKPGYHVIPFDELDSAAKEIDKIPKEQSVTIVGHSAGGGGAYNLAGRVTRPIDRLVTVDPVQTNLAKFVRDWATGFKKPKNVKVWENYAPASLKIRSRANAYVRYLLTRLDDYRLGADRNIRIDDEDHSMRSSGLRVDEWLPNAADKLEQGLNKGV